MSERRIQFSLGRILATPGALEALTQGDIHGAIARHSLCEWGDLDHEDKQANADALTHGGRLLSAYHSQNQIKFWIITEADRSATTVLLPDEY
ncbi:MAG: hypothetical protein K1X78_09545 [Verrucomicrobiaceae bacterium]|nr:hypothetical protein [Verrucomicrobiaceae bacterium]